MAKLAEEDADLQDRADLQLASVGYLAEPAGTLPPSVFPRTTLGAAGSAIEYSARRAIRKLTVEVVQDQALADWMERRQMLLDIVDGKETSTREVLDKEGNPVVLNVAPTITERLRGLELLARYSSMGRKADRESLEHPERALAEILGLSVEEVKALAVETPSWSLVDAPPAGLDELGAKKIQEDQADQDRLGPPRTV